MKQVDTITITELFEMAQKMYGNLVKGVVDVEMHVDAEQFFLENGSINIARYRKSQTMNVPYSVDRQRWSKMNIFEQMGNIYSEVGRSFSAKRRNNEADCLQAVGRAIDLFDATISGLIKNKSPKVKEVLRSKEAYLTAIFDKSDQAKNDQGLERYFLQYAVASRLAR